MIVKPICLALVTMLVTCAIVNAQNGNLHIEVRAGAAPVGGAVVVLNGTTYTADAEGALTVSIAPGAIELVVSKEGLAPTSISFQLRRVKREASWSNSRVNRQLRSR